MKRLFLPSLALWGFPPVQIVLQKPVYHHIRISPDRRCEMRVMLKRQPKMTLWNSRIFGLGHASDGQLFQHVLLGFALNLIHQFIERKGNICFLVYSNLMSEFFGKVGKCCQSVQIGVIVDPVNEGILPFILVKNELCHRAVCEKHKLLDQLMDILSLFNYQAEWDSLFIQFKFNFNSFEIYRSLLESPFSEFLA